MQLKPWGNFKCVERKKTLKLTVYQSAVKNETNLNKFDVLSGFFFLHQDILDISLWALTYDIH